MIKKIKLSIELNTFRALYYQLAARDAQNEYSFLLDSCGTGNHYAMGLGAKSGIIYQNKTLTYWHETASNNGLANKRAIQNKITHFKQLQQLLNYHQQKLNTRYSKQDFAEYTELPFVHGWVGAIGYEICELIEPSITPKTDISKLLGLTFFEPEHVICWRPETSGIYIISEDENWIENTLEVIESIISTSEINLDNALDINLKPQSDYAKFEAQTEQILEHIQAGNIYQANLSIPFSEDKTLSTQECIKLYDTLIKLNPSPFSGLFITPEITIISNSPERLVQYNANTNMLQTLPIAGTRGRGKNEEEDACIGEALLNNEKERAEHLMLLDLLRNDLGRVALPASVKVPRSFFLERYSHVTHLVSEVTAELDPQYGIWDVLGSVFPGGTITGCPKVRCMEILSEIETTSRGFYTGSLGYIDFRGHSDWNILIRSIFNDTLNDRLSAHFGAGIVADSTPETEYKECFRKFAALEKALTSIESRASGTLK